MRDRGNPDLHPDFSMIFWVFLGIDCVFFRPILMLLPSAYCSALAGDQSKQGDIFI